MTTWAQGPWTITSAVVRPSKYSGGEYVYVTMTNQQGQCANTNLSTDFDNNINWQQVLDAYSNNHTVIIDDIFYKTKKNKVVLDSYSNNPVIDADSKPNIISQQPDLQRQQKTQQEAQQRNMFNERRLREVKESGIEYKNNKWDVSPYMDKNGVFNTALQPNKNDNIETIREKLRLKSMIRYADMLNHGFHGNE